jgi:hypothetical protein
MKEISAKDIEIRAIQRAYDELKCLDPEGVTRALEWLRARFEHEAIEGRKAREASQRERIARMRKPRQGPTGEAR